jgi:putative oxidoreductase
MEAERSHDQTTSTDSLAESPFKEEDPTTSQPTPTDSLAESVHQLFHVLSQIRAQIMSRRVISEVSAASAIPVSAIKNWAVPFLATSISLVYIWFGLLKIAGASPVAPLIQATFPQFPEPIFTFSLGVVEVIIGICILNRKTRNVAVIALWMHLGGIFFGVLAHPSLYFTGGNVLDPSMYGEFVAKNIVLLAGSLVILMHKWEKQPAF